ncbi:MAG: helix-turn-helix transcriptional regulator [Oscillospiraceae bacterium]|nr:helix-turn-helix transcriptional regulator [Oscillospiraceae bacterium]
MAIGSFIAILFLIVNAIISVRTIVATVYVVYLLIKALRKYLSSRPEREERQENAKHIGQVIKNHRVRCNMTQEFLADRLGVSRQAVSKWEKGRSDPSTTNLIALAKIFDITPEEMLKEITAE